MGVGSLWPLLSTKLANIKKLKTWMSYEILEMKVPKNLIKERIGDGKSCEFFCKLLLGLSKLGSNSLALVLECCFDNIVFCAFILGW